MKYILSGDPRALTRPRFRKDGKTYDPQSVEKERARYELKFQHRSRPLLIGPLELIVTFFMPIPKTKARKVAPYDYHHIKPDLSNLIKFVEDVANDIIFTDDAIIASIQAVKYYAIAPRTEFILVPLERKECYAQEIIINKTKEDHQS